MKKLEIKEIISVNDIDIINENFSEIIRVGGGIFSIPGLKGIEGQIGIFGAKGNTGVKGEDGTKWAVCDDPSTYDLKEGDYWVDTSDSSIKKLQSNGYIDTGYLLKKDEPSLIIENNSNILKLSGNDPSKDIFILSDLTSEQNIYNNILGKFNIITNGEINFSPILEFGRDDVDVDDVGEIKDYSSHPSLYWTSSDAKDSSFGMITLNSKFTINVKGDLNVNSKNIDISSQNDINILYDSTNTIDESRIYSKSGFSFNCNFFNLDSDKIKIYDDEENKINTSLYLSSVLEENIPMLAINSSITNRANLTSKRSLGLNNDKNNNDKYHILLKNSTEDIFSLSASNILKIKKTTEGISYGDITTIKKDAENNILWYYLTKTSTDVNTYPSIRLEDGNTMIISPIGRMSEKIGICIDNTTAYSWVDGLNNNESITIRIYNTSDIGGAISEIRYIVIGNRSLIGNKIDIGDGANCLEITISKDSLGTGKYICKAYCNDNAKIIIL